MVKGTAIVLTNGLFDSSYAKTAHGLLRGTERFTILAIIDHAHAGKDSGQILLGKSNGIPIFGSVNELFEQSELKPAYCIIGVALHGGHLPDGFRNEIKAAINHSCSIVNGLHHYLSEDPDFIDLAARKSIELIDIRKPKHVKELRFWTGDIYSVKVPIIAVLGIDCAVGKRTTCRFLMEAYQEKGINAEMIYTGQTGWMQGHEHGFIFDSTLNDFISGELEGAIISCYQENNPEIILLEGQSALRNPSGPAGSEFILSGNARGIILQIAPGRTYFDGVEEYEQLLPEVEDEVRLIQHYTAKVLGIAINEENMTETAITDFQKQLELQLEIPIVRPFKEGVTRLIESIDAYYKS